MLFSTLSALVDNLTKIRWRNVLTSKEDPVQN